MQPIPLVDLSAIHEPIAAELTEAFTRVLNSGAFSSGPEVEAFEAALSEYCGVEYAIGVGSGTSALQIALMAAGIGPGDEVIVPANTFFATVEAIHFAGAQPVLADVDPATANLDVEAVRALVTEKTAAIVMVDLYGQPADADALEALAGEKGLFLLEDAAQSIGGSWSGRPAGSLGDAAGFSFYPGKNLGALGEAGAITTNNAEVDRAARLLRAHGQPRRYEHDVYAFNERMDGLQGAFLAVKLAHLPLWQKQRQVAFERYEPALAAIDGCELIGSRPEAVHVHHLLVVQVPHRDDVLAALNDRGVGAGIHYPHPIHALPPCQHLGCQGQFPVTEALADSILSLPLYPGITEEQIDRVVATLTQILDEQR